MAVREGICVCLLGRVCTQGRVLPVCTRAINHKSVINDPPCTAGSQTTLPRHRVPTHPTAASVASLFQSSRCRRRSPPSYPVTGSSRAAWLCVCVCVCICVCCLYALIVLMHFLCLCEQVHCVHVCELMLTCENAQRHHTEMRQMTPPT